MGKVMEKPVQDDESTEVALRRRGPRHDRQPATTKSTPSTNGTDADVHDSVKSSAGQEISIFINEGERKSIESIDEIDGNVHSKILGSLLKGSSLPPSRMSSEKPIMPTNSTSQATTGNGTNSFIEDLYLETVYKNDVAHQFYCPNCNSCIQKVIIRGHEPVSNHELFRCSSCFSFLIPIGNWLFPNLVSKDDDTPLEKGDILDAIFQNSDTVSTYYYAIQFFSIMRSALECKIFQGKENKKTKSNVTLVVSGSELRGSKKLEIVKSIVYGGLIESITSLSVVTSAASADAATSSIIALSLANLIGGIFTLAHSVSYFSIPPAVYGYTFMETDDKNLMLVAVSVSSLLCIATLAIGKAHIQKPPKNHFKIVLSYLVTGIMASGVSYVAGDLAKKLIEKLGWFEPGKAVFLPLTGMSSGRLSWASY
ncbi:hypothetical protein SADUNF_Sadunf01G0102700 [Salix dunnii]|uniref:Uncharacterized protein n=1 Tax=Salix dunnii TaxID=1413687 RepID=A0A835NB42_9ROSI|nr:hypothetical protein SADUNF_Sadunf01G0102700 [Salix dunnii]